MTPEGARGIFDDDVQEALLARDRSDERAAAAQNLDTTFLSAFDEALVSSIRRYAGEYAHSSRNAGIYPSRVTVKSFWTNQKKHLEGWRASFSFVDDQGDYPAHFVSVSVLATASGEALDEFHTEKNRAATQLTLSAVPPEDRRGKSITLYREPSRFMPQLLHEARPNGRARGTSVQGHVESWDTCSSLGPRFVFSREGDWMSIDECIKRLYREQLRFLIGSRR